MKPPRTGTMDHQLEEPYSGLFLMLLTVEPNKAMTPLMKCEVPISKARLFGRALINAPKKANQDTSEYNHHQNSLLDKRPGDLNFFLR